ncbi:DUF3500 domain-containing protein [Corynebacterium lowii]|uniref:DUF3500 domain-containing protein n=1 Tax=Corynebacterium lowii TaxID=1544413 RepID=A0A0Q1AJM9_9CORY|nr:DUF3500 domain-containing protein [Corynebacterium lowii]KQB87069.1 hypothetical protein Clow_00116 [Corynebacterium lowii]MDP9852347.1 putative heme/steroid binding protein [Corynebacterium lowii]
MTAKNPRFQRRLLPLVSTALVAGLALTACSSDSSDSAAAATTTASTSTANSTVSSASSTTGASASTTKQTVKDTAAAAQAFLDTLSEEQKSTVVKDYEDDDKSITWSNFPVTFVERAGINLKDLNDEQREAAMNVLKALLNDDAYATVTGIMGGDEYLLENSNSTEDSLGQYYIAFYGDPSDSSAWTLQFGGHHLGLNATMDTDTLTFAPTHLGTQPAEYVNEQGETIQTMDKTYTTAFAFYNSLNEEQKTKLYQGEQVDTMVCAPGSTCDYPTGTGLKGSDLTDEQKELLIDVIANWVGMADEETTNEELDAIRATLDDTYVNWSGETVYDINSGGDGIYFQISGPKVYIEFANQQGSAGADVEGVVTAGWGHVHTIYRDPSNDYAGSVEQQQSSGPGGGAPGGMMPGDGGPGGNGGPGSSGGPGGTAPGAGGTASSGAAPSGAAPSNAAPAQ